MSTLEWERLLNVRDLADLTGRAKSTLWRDLREGRLPPAVKVGHSTRWRSSDVREWIQKLPATDRANPRRGGNPNGARRAPQKQES